MLREVKTFFHIKLYKYTNFDDLFTLVFYISLGLLPGCITLFSDKALQIPFFATALAAAILLISKSSARKSISAVVGQNIFHLLALLILVIFVGSLNTIFSNQYEARILVKPFIFILFTFLICFFVTNCHYININTLTKILFVGIVISLSFLLLETILGYYYEDQPFPPKRVFIHLYIYKLTRNLEIISILLFVAGFSIDRKKLTFYLTTSLAAFTWFLSLIILGSWRQKDGWHFAVKHVDSETVQYGLLVAMLVFVLAHKLPRLVTNVTFGSICVVLLSAPWIFQLWYVVAPNFRLTNTPIFLIRAEIWDGISRKILESPLLGYGIDSSRYLNHIEIANAHYTPSSIWHPHNMYLQLWLDLGLPGVLTVFGLLIFAWRKFRSMSPTMIPSAIAGVAMLELYILATHSMWQTWNMALISIFVVLITIMTNSAAMNSHPS